MFSKLTTLFSKKSRKSSVRQPLLNKKRKSKTAKKRRVRSPKKIKKVRSAKKSSSSIITNMPIVLMNGPNNFSKQMMNKGGLEYTYSKNGRKQTKLYKASNLPPPLNLAKK